MKCTVIENRNVNSPKMWAWVIDISWVDWSYKSSTCDFIYILSWAPPFILWWSNFEILFAPLQRIGWLHCQAIPTEHGPYITERTQKAVYLFWHSGDLLEVKSRFKYLKEKVSRELIPFLVLFFCFEFLYTVNIYWSKAS
jgi:hypothetical protein